ncbi:MAG: serine/threonine-protein kinase, partial [Planctomycetota bacterium]|nr:serine/threonine-protein kinase [Planctomycetota bacterium]
TPATTTPTIRARYRLLDRLGEGGFGEVFLGRSMRPPKRLVAVKVLRTGMAGERILRRFESEQQALARLDHPAIAGIFESGTTDDGRPFFAMPLAVGEPITAHAQHARLSTRRRVELFRTLVDAVAHAHRRGVLHRDLKPANVVVGTNDSGTAMAVIDFGIAKSLDEPLSEHTLVTEAGAVVGTPEYMSPEQADGLPEAADVRSDVYALGTILYELLCRHRPIDRETLRRGGVGRVGETIRTTLVAPPSRRCRLDGRTDEAARIAGDLDAVCMKALAKDQADRYAGADAMLADLDRFLAGEPVLARAHSWRDNLRVAVRRHRTAVAVAASVALALAVGLASTVAFAIQAKRESEARRVQADRAATLADFLAGIFGQLDPEQARGRDTTLLRIMLDDAAEELLDNEHQLPNDVAAELHLVLGTAYLKLLVLEPAEFHIGAAQVGLTRSTDAERDRHEVDALVALLRLRNITAATPEHVQQLVDAANRLFDRFGWPADPDATLPGPVVNALSVLAHSSEGYTIENDRLVPCTGRTPQPDAERSASEPVACRSVLLERVFALAESTFGPDHRVTLKARSDLGRAYELEGNAELAHRWMLDALAASEAALGRQDPITLDMVICTQIAASKVGGNTDYGDWLPDFEAAFPPNHPRLSAMRQNHGWTLRNSGRNLEAVPLFESAYRSARDNLGPIHHTTIWNLTSLLQALADLPDAKACEREIVAIFDAYAARSEADPGIAAELLKFHDWFEQWQGRPPAYPPQVLDDPRLRFDED